MHQGDFKDAVGFSTGKVKGEDSVQMPRLNLACHGDHVRGDMVFKEQKVEIMRRKKKHPKRSAEGMAFKAQKVEVSRKKKKHPKRL